MKKGRHRRFEEARAFKRSQDVDLEKVFEDIAGEDEVEHKPEHDAWADLAEEWDSKSADANSTDDGLSDEEVSESE